MIEILQNTQAQLSVTFSTGDADGTVTVKIVDADNNVVVNNQPASHSGQAGSGAYTYSLPPQPAPAWLTVTWTGTFSGVVQSVTTAAGAADGTGSEVQVVGGHLFTIAALRQFGDAVLADKTRWPDQTLIDARSRVTVLVEDFCNVCFFPRYGRVAVDGNLKPTVWLPDLKVNVLRSVVINGVPLTQTELGQVVVFPNGKLYRLGLWPIYTSPRNIVIGYEHGYLAPPADLARAAMMITRYELVTTELAERFVTFQNDLGITRVAQPGGMAPTGIPIVDATLNRYRQSSPYELPA